MAVLITLNVVRGGGVEEVRTSLTAQDIAFNPQYMTNVQGLTFADQPSGAKATFRYADPSSGRGADQVDVTNPFSDVITLANA